MPSIATTIAPERIVELQASGKRAALAELAAAVAASAELDGEALLATILEREELSSTGIEDALALPHARSPMLKTFVTGIGRCADGIDFGSPDGQPVKLLLLLAGPGQADRAPDYLKLLRSATQFLRANKERILELEDLKMAYALSQEF